MIDKENILQAYRFRHACKVFDPEKMIPSDTLEAILESFRLSPSSFGMEPWRMILIRDAKLKKALKPHCWNQEQITTASHLLVMLAQTKKVQEHAYIDAMFSRRNLSSEAKEQYIKRYKDFIKDKDMYSWCSKQIYLASGNLATTAAMLGVDSCFIEGFEKKGVEELLALDTTKEEVALIVTLGYRLHEPPSKQRRSLDEIVEYRD